MAWFKTKILRGGSQAWYLAWRAGRQIHTEKVCEVTPPRASPPKEARQRKAEIEALLIRSPFGAVRPAKMTFEEFAREWAAQREADPNLSPKTRLDQGRILRKHLLPRFASFQLARISPADVQRFLAELNSRWVARQARGILHKMFEDARRLRYVSENPIRDTRFSTPRNPRRSLWDEEQVRMFLAEARRASKHYPLYLLALTTGLRPGEILSLRRKDLNLAVGVATVNQSLLRVGKRIIFKDPKTEAGRRGVGLSPLVTEELRRHLSTHPHELVFCQPDGKPLHEHNIARRDFRRVMNLEGLRKELRARGIPDDSLPKPLPRIRLYDLRHLNASLMALVGVAPRVAMERLGHSSPTITLGVYTHTMGNAQHAAARLLEERLFATGTETGTDGTR